MLVWRDKGVNPLFFMTSIVNIALAGFLVWSGAISGMPVLLSQTHVPVAIIDTDKNTLIVKLTGYNALPEQTNGDPDTTASGVFSNPAVIAARSRDLAETLPYGTVISLEMPKNVRSCGFKEVEHLIGYRVIADTMHMRKSQQIDVMFDENEVIRLGGKDVNPAVVVGVCDVTVRIVGKITLKDIPDTQAELALLMNKNKKLAFK